MYEIQRRIIGETEETEKAAVKVISIPKEPSEIRQLMENGYDPKDIQERLHKDLQNIAAEYRIMAKLKGNANIVYCDDIYYEEKPEGMGWTLYIRMELLTPLSKMIKDGVTYGQVVKLGMDMAHALKACKENLIIHRDIKPSNIMVAKDGNFKLGDFGVAKKLEKASGGTKTGTYSYMAPEVYLCKDYDLSADIYSLGMVLYWLLNKRCGPFLPLPPTLPSTAQMDQAQERRFGGEALPAPACGSQRLKDVVLKACAFDPAQRYTDPQELYEALTAVHTELSDKNLLDAPLWQANKQAEKPAPDVYQPTMGNSWEQEYGETVAEPRPQEPSVHPQPAPKPQPAQPSAQPSTQKKKSKAVAVLLLLFPYTGLFGVHDFYLGKHGSGLLKLCTVNFVLLGWIYDLLLMLFGRYKTKDGNYL